MCPLETTGDFQAVEIERPVQTNIDQPCDSAFNVVSARRFHDVDAREKLRRNILQRYEAPRRCEYLAAVEERCDVGQTADQELIGFGGIPADLNAGDVLQRLDHVVVGQLADIFGHDRIRRTGPNSS